MRISDWSSDVCSSDLDPDGEADSLYRRHDRLGALISESKRIDITFGIRLYRCCGTKKFWHIETGGKGVACGTQDANPEVILIYEQRERIGELSHHLWAEGVLLGHVVDNDLQNMIMAFMIDASFGRSEEHTSELQSLMRISYA